ncbi:phostensin-like [Megalops cyprinoides]|uniref:phostensin-like n=1 Tax=Megalops cyprinoides TaxID=118141 RepID=UPI001864C58E|nr:phostensin-like [Megalops cyprinoides]
MSVSSLPEWKQMLLERKRKEEEERERKEREEEERLASMPAWKRGIIQRRREKQEGGGTREREEAPGSRGEARRGSDRPSEEPQGPVSSETICPVRQNPFVRSQCRWKERREGESVREVIRGRENRTREEGQEERGVAERRIADRRAGQRPSGGREVATLEQDGPGREGPERGPGGHGQGTGDEEERSYRGRGREGETGDGQTWHHPAKRSRDPPGGADQSGTGGRVHPASLPSQAAEETVWDREREREEQEGREKEEQSYSPTNPPRDSEGHPITPRLFSVKAACPKTEYEIQIPRTPFYGVEVGPEGRRAKVGEEGPPSVTDSLCSVTQEAGSPLPGPRLPASLSRSLSASEEEDTASELPATCPHSPPSPGQRDEGQIEPAERQRQDAPGGGEEGRGREEESPEKDSSEWRYRPPSLSPSPAASPSLSPSPPLLPSPVDMSRIYNLRAAAGSRTAGSFGGRKAESPAQCLHLRPREEEAQREVQQEAQEEEQQQQRRPEPQLQELKRSCLQEPGTEIRGARGDGAAVADEPPAMRTVQQQLEQLRLREEEARQARQGGRAPRGGRANATAGERPAEQPAEPREDERTQAQALRTPQPHQPRSQKTAARQPPANQSQPPRSFTVTPRSALPPENAPKNTEQGSTLPSPSPSAALFSLRPAAGGQGKRGHTITITPRRAAGGAGPAAASAATKAPPQTQTATPNGMGEGSKKRYPTADEIEVIGGYQTLERSCLVKHRGTPKGVKVCFDEAKLERVCEYPSESSLLASLPCPAQSGADGDREEREGEEEDEDEEEEKGAFMSGGSRILGSKSGRMLKVDESCRR